MKVLHVLGDDLSGGAARGAYWLHLALKELGISSKLLITRTNKKEIDIISLVNNKKDKFRQILINRFDQFLVELYKNRTNTTFSPAFWGNDITKLKQYQDADIIHLHWINGGMLGIDIFSKFDKPIVWTFRDMWPFTGGCHYSLGCTRYQDGCGNCIILKSNHNLDLSSWTIKRKKRKYGQNIFPVVISNWLRECAKKSHVFGNYDIQVIHNGVKTDLFKPLDKRIARQILNLPQDIKIIAIGAKKPKDTYKGFDKFLETLKLVKNKDYFYLFFGNLEAEELKKYDIHYISLGLLNDDISLVIAYSAADVFIAPSIQEAFGKTIIESMACGTPVVCFDTAGPKDIITHKLDGYKAISFDIADLANGIEWTLNHKNYRQLTDNSRKKVVNEFEIGIIAKKYKSLYQEILNDKKRF